jgi:hypothetical protein
MKCVSCGIIVNRLRRNHQLLGWLAEAKRRYYNVCGLAMSESMMRGV